MSELILDLVRARVTADKVRHVSEHKKGEWHSPCPVCGGDDRFHIWPYQDGGTVAQKAGVTGTWWCRTCDKTGDVIGLLMFADGLEFKAACKELRIELSESGRRLTPLRMPSREAEWKPAEWDVPSEPWRQQATKLALYAHEQLLAYPMGLEYMARRGLPLEAVMQFRLGFLPAEDRKTGTCLYRARSAFGLADKPVEEGSRKRQVLWIPRGFTIPLWHPGWDQPLEVHRLRIRRPKGDLKDGDAKYMLLTGSGQAPMVLRPVGIAPSLAVWVVVEAELDALAVHFACGGRVGVLATLTNKGKPDAMAHRLLKLSPRILVALDYDQPGKKNERPGFQGWEWWQKQYAQARRWPVPLGKDPGEAYSMGVNLWDWVSLGMPAALASLRGGSLGMADSGERGSGAGDEEPMAAYSPSAGLEQAAVSFATPQRWAGADARTPLCNITLPEGCLPLTYYRTVYASKFLHDELPISCPRTDPPWWWVNYRECSACAGHAECIVDILTSRQMLDKPVFAWR